MSRSERWNTKNEIIRRLNKTTNSDHGAGPILFVDNMKKYSDDGESHIKIVGSTGKGKSQCGSLPFIREVINKGESLIMLDPKGEGYKYNQCFIPKEYQQYCIDFRAPRRSPDTINPLQMPYQLFCSKDKSDHDIAAAMISELWRGVYPNNSHSDPFWSDSAASLLTGLTYALFETGIEEEINLESIATIMEDAESKPDLGLGRDTFMRRFCKTLPPNSLAKRKLISYTTSPDQTRGSIYTTALTGLEIFNRSKGLMEMLSKNSLNILEIDVSRPFAITIILPDENDVYDALSGVLISQFSQHLIRVAQTLGGSLPIRVNFLLEELGSIGRGIPSLPNLMVAGRSRNFRLVLILQSNHQLTEIYGESKSEIINSCVGITILFSTNSWETLVEYSKRCGEKQVEYKDRYVTDPLITPSQLAAMPTGTALVMIDNQYKYITHFPFFYQLYDNSSWKAPSEVIEKENEERSPFDFEAFIKRTETKYGKSSNNANKIPVPDFLRSKPNSLETPYAIIPDEFSELDRMFEFTQQKFEELVNKE